MPKTLKIYPTLKPDSTGLDRNRVISWLHYSSLYIHELMVTIGLGF